MLDESIMGIGSTENETIPTMGTPIKVFSGEGQAVRKGIHLCNNSPTATLYGIEVNASATVSASTVSSGGTGKHTIIIGPLEDRIISVGAGSAIALDSDDGAPVDKYTAVELR